MSRTTLAVLLAVFLSAPAALAQHQEQITINVVEVPVWVTRFDGVPVDGLTAKDFDLFVNGKPHPIEYFDVLREADGFAGVVAEEVRRPALERRRLYLLVFDLTSLSLERIWKARDRALRFIEGARPDEAFAVATLRRGGLHFAVPFTTDRAAISHAVRTLSASKAGDAFNLAMLDRERAELTTTAELNAAPSAAFHDTPSVRLALIAEKTALRVAREAHQRVREVALASLTALAGALAPLSGVKHVVVLGEGNENAAGFETYVTRLHEQYRAAGATFNAIDIAGPQSPTFAGAGMRTAGQPVGGSNELLKTLAAGTGGTVAYNFQTIRKEHSITYVLGFRPPADQVRGENRIRVRVRNEPLGSYVRHRQAYSAGGPATAGGEHLFLADILVNDIEQNGVTVNLDYIDSTLVATIPGREVLGFGKDGATEMDVFLYVFDEKNVVAWWKHVRLRVDVEKARELLDGNAYTIRQPIDLAPGRYSAKVLVNVAGRDATGFRRTEFALPKG